ncbi:ribonuclease HII [Salinibacter sp. 10B]|uniref:ribonuclease HII n=1 Tax=Salinibacter sp. 10B TaxID=1923971 RepID=UPI000CF4FE2F|nr:ribonuclease HII [Salinibacter sp. 10B]PQJ33768.1 ribonuclease HII [Salinibacter sp. 10B]
MLDYEQRLWTDGYQRVAGLDEAGRGCLAGPVVAAAVVLPPETEIPAIADSKALSEEQRLDARTQIEEQALSFAIAHCSPDEIDELNILQAALEAMRRAASECQPPPDFLLVDGNQWSRSLTEAPWPYETVVKGDATSQSIAAASILAKTERDATMRTLHDQHPEYGWDTNVGYPTQQHYDALAEHGVTPHHRQSFTLFRD